MKINGYEYKIMFLPDTENPENLLGQTWWEEQEIRIWYEKVNKVKQYSMLQTLMHEIGHAHYNGLPPHVGYDKGTDAYADAFELSIQYYELAKKEIEKFNKRKK